MLRWWLKSGQAAAVQLEVPCCYEEFWPACPAIARVSWDLEKLEQGAVCNIDH